MRVIVGIDPGVSTGVAFALETVSGFQYQTATMVTPEDVWDIVATQNIDVVIIEQFAAQTISRYGLHTVEIVGGVMAICHRNHTQIIRDTPQERRPYLPLARAMVEKGKGHTIHEVDALSHVLRYMYHNVPEAGIKV